MMCGGWGHYAPKCPTFKDLEKYAKSTPALHIAWGKYKALHKLEDVDEVTKAKLAGKKRKSRESIELLMAELSTFVR